VQTLLAVEDLRVDIPTPAGRLQAVRGIDLSLGQGETLCLVGESGCGKTVTALALMGLLPAGAAVRARLARRLARNDPDAGRSPRPVPRAAASCARRAPRPDRSKSSVSDR
jgi:ABC-type glutathione transport system ATPase component